MKFVLKLGVIVVAAIAAIFSVTPANASDLQFTVSAEGITLPPGETFLPEGHVNINADPNGAWNMHFESKCIERTDYECAGKIHNDAQYIGKSFIPWEAFGLVAPYCVTWVQVSQFNYHFDSSGGGTPVCVGQPPTNDFVWDYTCESVNFWHPDYYRDGVKADSYIYHIGGTDIVGEYTDPSQGINVPVPEGTKGYIEVKAVFYTDAVTIFKRDFVIPPCASVTPEEPTTAVEEPTVVAPPTAAKSSEKPVQEAVQYPAELAVTGEDGNRDILWVVALGTLVVIGGSVFAYGLYRKRKGENNGEDS